MNRGNKEFIKKLDSGFFVFLRILCVAAAGLAVLSLAAVTVYVLINGVGKLTPELLFGDYSETPSILPAFVGTLELIAVSCLTAIPIGIGSAIFLSEYTEKKGRLVKIIRIATETLAGIPSIVYGLFGYLVFVVALGWGYSIVGGGITLAVMILPVIVRSVEESLLAVPQSCPRRRKGEDDIQGSTSVGGGRDSYRGDTCRRQGRFGECGAYTDGRNGCEQAAGESYVAGNQPCA